MISLYDHPLSGNCYKVRLLLSHLGVHYERITIDFFKGENKTEDFKKLNPNQKIPVIRDGDLILWESSAILLYLGKKFSPNIYYSEELDRFGLISQWLFFGKTSIDPSLARARFMTRFVPEEKRDEGELRSLRNAGESALQILEDQLKKNDFLAGSYSLADIGCFPYVNMAEEGGVSLTPFPSVISWCERIGSQPGYISIVLEEKSHRGHGGFREKI
ncbi:MAG TPA: glutathione S-transferase family protein [Thermodesulfobacteriota bacterium]|jgi:glutathione S-transferase